MNRVITISRQFGSGGRTVGKDNAGAQRRIRREIRNLERTLQESQSPCKAAAGEN